VPAAIRRGRLLEKNHFNSIWVTDVLFEGGPELILPDIFPLMTILGVNTKKVILGSAVIDALSRHPAKIATATATIDNMLNGRTIFGLGGGETINHEPFGIPTTHVYAKLRETIQMLKLLWTADHLNPASFEGKYYTLRDAYVKIKPKSKPHPPIYLPAFGPRMLAMTGELADGWIPFNHTPDSYRKILAGPIRAAGEKAGRSFSDFEPANIFVAAISRDPEKAAEAVKKEAKSWLAWSPDILGIIAPEVKHPGKRQPFIKSRARDDVQAQDKLAQEIPDEVALKTALWGTPDHFIQQLEGFVNSGLRHAILFFVPTPTDSVEKMIALFGSKVMPYFKSR
jgi:alkanesulfonate monooxygenase SsuD/methylene tetrahydromethanopterin reductase-like flavin-dependent oxidoreductase (luciferase family)